MSEEPAERTRTEEIKERLIRERDEALSLLKEVEFISGINYDQCRICGGWKKETPHSQFVGHTSTCRLAKVLKGE